VLLLVQLPRQIVCYMQYALLHFTMEGVPDDVFCEDAVCCATFHDGRCARWRFQRSLIFTNSKDCSSILRVL